MTAKIKPLLFPFLLVLYEIATYLSNDMYLPALPDMMRELNLSMKQAQWTLTTWFVGSASLPLVMGVISDRYGRRLVLLTGGVIYTLATVVCALTTNANSLLAARFVEGAAIPSMMVAGYACIHELYEQKEAIRILALMSSITVLAPALGPLLGSIVLYFSSWRGIFWIIAAWAALAIFFLNKWMPETHPPEKRHPVHFGTLFKQYWRILTNKTFMLLLLVLGFTFMGFIVWITAGPLLVIESFHYSPLVFGLIQAEVFAAYILGNHWVKYLLEWVEVKSLILGGLGITLCGGLLALLFAIVFPDKLVLFVIAMTIYSFGSALCFAPLNRSIIEASEEPMGVRVALFTVLWTGFAVLGSLIASLFFNGAILSIALPVAVAIVISCLCMVAAMLRGS
ncbi:Multidrug transporter MdfA [Aquicella siphonis]|uniref:Bcr/CflA family efflux transporter n=1 Tax=Aquicella siphonis TaxID=254247 RepID=A0A5E4PL16_9COXI|nr:multidrug effflux MFS transporter [Aquicella siphonis]VVC76952.1 Multidrug transporter MdfA [Aquicella siphonis]